MSNFVAISDARANLPKLIDDVATSLERVFITVNGQPKAVVISAEELESIEETAEILAIPGARDSIIRGMEDIKMGRLTPLEEVLKLEYGSTSDRRSKKAAGKNSSKSKK
jgi:prevent-host-death family protein